MHGAGSGDPSGKDLASLGDVLLESIDVLVIYGDGLVSAELADLFSVHPAVVALLLEIFSFH